MVCLGKNKGKSIRGSPGAAGGGQREVPLPQLDPEPECGRRGQRRARAPRYCYGNAWSSGTTQLGERSRTPALPLGSAPARAIPSPRQGLTTKGRRLPPLTHRWSPCSPGAFPIRFQRGFHGSSLPAQAPPCSTRARGCFAFQTGSCCRSQPRKIHPAQFGNALG